VACPELFSATTDTLVEPSRKVTDPPVTLTPADFTVAVRVSEAPVLIEELDKDSDVVVALGCGVDVPPPPEHPGTTPATASMIPTEILE
jgi:hypothetical protein